MPAGLEQRNHTGQDRYTENAQPDSRNALQFLGRLERSYGEIDLGPLPGAHGHCFGFRWLDALRLQGILASQKQ